MSPLENVAIAEPIDDLQRRQPFRNGDRMQDLLAADENVHHFAEARALLEQIFAGLNFRALAFDQKRDIQREGTIDHALALEFADDLGQVGAWNDIEDLVRGQGPRLAHPLLAPDQAEHGDDGGDEQE